MIALRINPSVQVYKITDCKLLSLRGYTPDEEKVSEVLAYKTHCQYFPMVECQKY